MQDTNQIFMLIVLSGCVYLLIDEVYGKKIISKAGEKIAAALKG